MPKQDPELVARAAQPKEKAYRLRFGRNLSLIVAPHGRRTWQFRCMRDGKAVERVLGTYPTLSYRQAVELAEKAREELQSAQEPDALTRFDPWTATLPEAIAAEEEWYRQMKAHSGRMHARGEEADYARNIPPSRRWLAAREVNLLMGRLPLGTSADRRGVVEMLGRREPAPVVDYPVIKRGPKPPPHGQGWALLRAIALCFQAGLSVPREDQEALLGLVSAWERGEITNCDEIFGHLAPKHKNGARKQARERQLADWVIYLVDAHLACGRNKKSAVARAAKALGVGQEFVRQIYQKYQKQMDEKRRIVAIFGGKPPTG